MSKSPEQIIKAVQQGGVIGAGGAGFPTHVKLQAKVDAIIANGSECEPLLSSDLFVMENFPDLIIEGMQYAMIATGAKKGVIGLKEHYKKAVISLTKALPKDGSIRLHLLENYYPAGDEFLLVYDVTGKVIPEGGIPLHVGVVVSNVTTFMQIAEAVNGKPVTERAVSLVGEFKEPKVVTVPIGTTYQKLIKLAGGTTSPDIVLIDGGPMMGKIVDDWSMGIGKTTSGVLALPRDHFLVTMAKKPLGQVIKQSKAACCQCFRCSDLCPRNLLGHNLFPHKTMRTVDYNIAESEWVTSAFLCSQCGVCELIACDFMMLSPRKIFAAYRQALVSKGIKNPHQNKPKAAREELNFRKIGIPVLMKKLGITKYDIALPYEGKCHVQCVRVPLKRHVGAPAKANVTVGQKVRACDLIASTPSDQLGAYYHSPINGTITQMTDQFIEVTS
jgi:Na+-translocating ferredoxin:NAD+ oxidoreductase RnfC subunit